MKKLPVKWIKRVFFGRKKFKSRSKKPLKPQVAKDEDAQLCNSWFKKAADDDLWVDKQEESAQACVSHVISRPPQVQGGSSHVISHPSHVISSVSINRGERESPCTIPTGIPLRSQDNVSKHGVVSVCPPPQNKRLNADQDIFINSKEGANKSACMIQAVFKGYQARVAFRALQGIISLQSLIRGRLVIRQATTALFCICRIVKLQAIFRDRHLRLSGACNQVSKKSLREAKDPSTTTSMFYMKKNLSSNQFIFSLISLAPIAKPVQLHYAQGEPNSVHNWLNRWSSSNFWRTDQQPRNIVDSKLNTQPGSHGLRIGLNAPKCNDREVSSAQFDTDPKAVPLSDKTKQNMQKVKGSPGNRVHGQQTTHTKLPKRNQKKIMSSSKANVESNTKTDSSMLKSMNPSRQTVHGVKSETTMATATTSFRQSSQADNDTMTPLSTSGSDILVMENTECERVDALTSADHNLESPPWTSSIHPAPGRYHVETIRRPNVDILILHEADNGLPLETVTDEPSPMMEPVDGNISHQDEHSRRAYLSSVNGGTVDRNHSPRSKWMPPNGQSNSQEILAAIKTAASDLNYCSQSPLQSRSSMPSTVSTKARLHGQRSPQAIPSVGDKNGFANRHPHLPSINGRSSHKVGQAALKGRNTNKLIQAEWKR